MANTRTYKVIHTPILLRGGKQNLLPESTSPNDPPVIERTEPIQSTKVPDGYVRTSNGWNFLIDAWSPNSKNLPTQIFLHHTAGWRRGDRSKQDIQFWNTRNSPGFDKKTGKRGYGSTHCLIDENGVLDRCVPENRKAFSEPNQKWTMSVEIQGLGWFNKFDKTKQRWYRGSSSKPFYCPKGRESKPVNFDGSLMKGGFRGYEIYEGYSKAAIDTLMNLIEEWCYRYNIKFIFNQDAFDLMFPLSEKTPLKGKRTPGVFSHCSTKKGSEKTDVFPESYLVSSLKKRFGKNNKFNPTVSSYDPNAKLPRTVPPWNPTKMEIGNFKGGWGTNQDKKKIPKEFPNHDY